MRRDGKPCWWHRWEKQDGLMGMWQLVDRCAKCRYWRVTDVLMEETYIYPPDAVKRADSKGDDQ